MVLPVYHPRLPGAVNVLSVSRPPVAGIPGVHPIIPLTVRPVITPSVTPTDMPQTPVYVGKMAPTLENDWKRPQDLSSGTPKGFGFYEFESAEGILRALRLLNKLNVDGQELMINVNQAMKEYLERYVRRKTENSKKIETQATEEVKKDDEGAKPPDGNQDAKPDAEHSNKEDNDSGNKESHDVANSGIITDEDRKADREASEKMKAMIEEKLKPRPLPPPPAQPSGDGSVNLSSEKSGKTRDEDSDVDTDSVAAKDKKETISDNKLTSEHDRPETTDRRRPRERHRDKELKQKKQRGFERHEREVERERVRKERGQRKRVEEVESQYEACLKEWEYRERDGEKERQYEKEKEKERVHKRRKDILYEEDGDDGSRKRWHRNVFEEKKRKRLHGADKIMDTEEIANEVISIVSEQDIVVDCNCECHIGDGNTLNGIYDELAMASVAITDTQSSRNAPTKKLGFGLVGSGKRTTVASVFHEEDDDEHKDKKIRPLVPIDYSTEELQAVQSAVSGQTSNLVAAAEFAKRYLMPISRNENWMWNRIEVAVQMRSLTVGTETGVMKMVLAIEMKRRNFLTVKGIEIMGWRNTRLLITGSF
ncbi:hypothetical protein TanjilG_15932 [Lupinus angustifolius]|uniref:RRM domain-containing protein n=1 Tax=Lupinus angustifolius TaxID=3871 RepID=A0A4P1RGH7_LUPAN|nr:hypothetical protein TanjilG_15932 [Lupinus angustifolius]